MPCPPRVLLVEDDPPMLARLSDVLATADITADQLQHAGSLAECRNLATAPDGTLHPRAMALVDLGLPDGSGIDLISWLRERGAAWPILVISAWSTEEMILGALRAGANGYVLKERDDLEIAFSIRNVLQGGAPIDPFIARRILDLANPLANPQANPPAPAEPTAPALREALSERERQILHHVATGMSNREIADSLHLSRWTIDTHIRHIYDKLAVNSRTQAVHRARARGLLR
ncbi:DNA-binding response regulator [Comamonas serinivorans]|uniref:DNA-binding response regulator n=1 Tax=Comamonas serinivorans TaxID=1082851 RepID=A0A1Y0ET08_9BURK|nr:response regulator transcription factor [Comamonas serinivorans]ARU06805.1 DNA-binding response regulator [Comamonas serinivorans]